MTQPVDRARLAGCLASPLVPSAGGLLLTLISWPEKAAPIWGFSEFFVVDRDGAFSPGLNPDAACDRRSSAEQVVRRAVLVDVRAVTAIRSRRPKTRYSIKVGRNPMFSINGRA